MRIQSCPPRQNPPKPCKHSCSCCFASAYGDVRWWMDHFWRRCSVLCCDAAKSFEKHSTSPNPTGNSQHGSYCIWHEVSPSSPSIQTQSGLERNVTLVGWWLVCWIASSRLTNNGSAEPSKAVGKVEQGPALIIPPHRATYVCRWIYTLEISGKEIENHLESSRGCDIWNQLPYSWGRDEFPLSCMLHRKDNGARLHVGVEPTNLCLPYRIYPSMATLYQLRWIAYWSWWENIVVQLSHPGRSVCSRELAAKKCGHVVPWPETL